LINSEAYSESEEFMIWPFSTVNKCMQTHAACMTYERHLLFSPPMASIQNSLLKNRLWHELYLVARQKELVG
jgi:hypothetical protein